MSSRPRTGISPALLSGVASLALLTLGIVACAGEDEITNPGGTLPPIRTTTTLASSQTTLDPYFEHYRLKPGDDLGAVARAFNVPLDVLIEYNADRLPDDRSKLPVGFEIVIPPHRWIEALPTTPTTAPSS